MFHLKYTNYLLSSSKCIYLILLNKFYLAASDIVKGSDYR